MAKVRITRKNGIATPYFWSDRERSKPSEKTVYKQTTDGIKRMRGVHFDPVARRIVKH
jgi:hypothetical protein